MNYTQKEWKCLYRYRKNESLTENCWNEGGDKGINNSSTDPEPTN